MSVSKAVQQYTTVIVVTKTHMTNNISLDSTPSLSTVAAVVAAVVAVVAAVAVVMVSRRCSTVAASTHSDVHVHLMHWSHSERWHLYVIRECSVQ
jgi:hypothetical protein